MKILLLIDAMDVGGAETHVATLGARLCRAGHEVWLLSEGGALEARVRKSGVHACRFPCPVRKNSPRGLCENVRFVGTLHRAEGFDVMHAHTRRTAFYLHLVRLLFRLLPRRFLPPHRQGAYRKKALRRLAFPSFVVTAHARFSPRPRRLCYWGDGTVAVSRDLATHLHRTFGVATGRIRVIPNGIDEAEFFPATKAYTGEFHVVFASRLDADCSAAAYALLRIAPALAAACAARGEALRVTFLGGGDQHAALCRHLAAVQARGVTGLTLEAAGATLTPADEFRRADVFVGVSRAALEALLCGCAVVLGGNEGFGGVLTEQNFDEYAAENFCCRSRMPLTDGALLSALCSLIESPPTERARAGARLREKALGRFSADGMAQQTLALYGALVSERCTLGVLIGGYAGCGNLGDDAILRQIISAWQGHSAPCAPVTLDPSAPPVHVHARVSLTALTGGREAVPFGVPCIPRKGHWPTLMRHMRHADGFVLGGGALLQNCSAHGTRSLLYYLSLLTLSRLCGCPFCLVANGVGPLHGRWARVLTGAVLRRAAAVSVREERARRTLCSLGLSDARIRIEQDPVLSVKPILPDRTRQMLRSSLPAWDGRPFVCVVPRPTAAAGLDALCAALGRVCRANGVLALFVPLDAQSDVALCRRLAHGCGGEVLVHTDEHVVAGVFALSCGVISLRLHGLILAAVADVGALCLPYSPTDKKTADFAAAAGQAVLPYGASADEVERALVALFSK